MSALDLFIRLANNLPGGNDLVNVIGAQPNDVIEAIKSNDSEMLKSCLSNKKIYSNEVDVTVF